MKSSLAKIIKSVTTFIYKRFEGNGSGNMIFLTSIIGFSLSALAQTGAIIANKKYTSSEKAFMVPQEIAEGIINIFSMFVITKPLQKFAKQYSKTGKLLTKEMKEYMQKNNLFSKRGDVDFDFGKSVRSIISEIEKSDKFIKSSVEGKNRLLSNHKAILQKHENMSDSLSAVITTAGGVLSTTFIAPVLRNAAAANYQRVNLNAIESKKEEKLITQPAYKSLPYITLRI